jgi:hypothetical protein
MSMIRTRLARRCLAALAVVALLGLGTVSLHHFYTDAMTGDEAGHDCLTCRVIGSSVALIAATFAGLCVSRAFAAPSFPSLGLEHVGFRVRLGSRAPPAALELLSVAF